MASIKIGISGFGRIGRIITRQLYANPELRKKIQIVAVNDLGSSEEAAFSFKYDTVHGKFPYNVKSDAESITLDSDKIAYLKYSKPSDIPWGKYGVDVVFECTGHFVDKEGASGHLKGGAKKVVISAPGKNVDLTVVMGVNHKSYDPSKHTVLSNASCTTNCLAPIAHVLHSKFGIKQGMMTTIHSYTSDQRLIDASHKDPRRARAAALNMIPTTTGAAKSVGEVIPALKGKLDGFSVRVPTANVSLTDLVAELEKPATKEEINAVLTAAAEGELKGFLAVSNEPLVSQDYNGNAASSTVDLQSTMVIGTSGNMIKVCSWYDNETGFSTRMLDLAAYMAERGI